MNFLYPTLNASLELVPFHKKNKKKETKQATIALPCRSLALVTIFTETRQGQHFLVSLLLDVPSFSFYLTKLEVIKMKTEIATILVLISSQKKLPVNVRTKA